MNDKTHTRIGISILTGIMLNLVSLLTIFIPSFENDEGIVYISTNQYQERLIETILFIILLFISVVGFSEWRKL